MHLLLKRQLERLGLAEDRAPARPADWAALLARLDTTYAQADQDRYTLERSLSISSDEMQALYRDLERSSQSELASERDKLQISAATLLATVEASPDGIYVVDEHRNIVSFNQRFLAVWGIPPEGAVTNAGMRALIAARTVDPTGFLARMEVIYAERPAISHDEFVLRDGRILECYSRAVRLPAGTALGRVWFVHDITQARRDHERLVELDEFKHEMTSLVVHDLKNVMMVVGCNVEFAMEAGDQANRDLQDTLAGARDAAARAIRLIGNLMDVARLENSSLALHCEPVDPDALFAAATKHRTSQLRTRGIGLTIEVERPPQFDGDFELLQRVLDNVLDNAVRYTPAGGRIEISARSGPEGTVRLAVGNTGTAIAPEDRARIFRKYGQGSRRVRGEMNAGLGLYFCTLAVAAHGGRLWVESTPELPTVFVIELVAATATATATASAVVGGERTIRLTAPPSCLLR
jgi:PAS domain S-box-containing protein